MIITANNTSLSLSFNKHTKVEVKDYGTTTIYIQFTNDHDETLTLSLDRDIIEQLKGLL